MWSQVYKQAISVIAMYEVNLDYTIKKTFFFDFVIYFFNNLFSRTQRANTFLIVFKLRVYRLITFLKFAYHINSGDRFC